MGEHRLPRHPIECIVHKVPRDSMDLDDCVKRTLHRLAEIVDVVLMMKEDGDDLHADFEPGAIVASFTNPRDLEAARPIIHRIRPMPEHQTCQCSIHDQAIYDLYEIEMDGKPLVTEEVFIAAVRKWFECPPGTGWRAVSPMSHMAHGDGRMQ